MLFNFLRKKKRLPKKVLLLSALPYDKDSFVKAYYRQDSDFIHSLTKLFGATDIDSIWSQYQLYALKLCKVFNLIEKYGGTVVKSFELDDLTSILKNDIVIVLAHHSDLSDEIEIGTGMVRTKEFVEYVPKDSEVIMDITSCYSAHLIPWVKARIPNSRIIGINCPTSLDNRLDVISYIIVAMAERGDCNYIEIFKQAWNRVGVTNSCLKDKDIMLGSKFQSTLYAPSEVSKGDDFIVSIFLHKSDKDNEIEIMARSIDVDAAKRNQISLKTQLKKGDLVEFQFQFNERQYDGISVDEYSKEIFWNDGVESIEFIVSVSEFITRSFFIGKIKMAVNKEMVGDMIFKISLVDNLSAAVSQTCCEVDFSSYNKSKEMLESGNELIAILENKLADLKTECGESSRTEIELCEKCIELIKYKDKQKLHTPLKVFVSSTSDMKRYRDILRQQIESCEMYADMYERWGQGNEYPRDVCCRHVLDSDIFVCILGAKYGFIEPLWKKSMTEIEYRVASNAGIPMLVYIIDNYKQKMMDISGEEQCSVQRQYDFIEELKNKRMVCLFNSDLSLQLQSNTELITLKNKLLS